MGSIPIHPRQLHTARRDSLRLARSIAASKLRSSHLPQRIDFSLNESPGQIEVEHVDVPMDNDVPEATNASPIDARVPASDSSDSWIADSAIVCKRHSNAL